MSTYGNRKHAHFGNSRVVEKIVEGIALDTEESIDLWVPKPHQKVWVQDIVLEVTHKAGTITDDTGDIIINHVDSTDPDNIVTTAIVASFEAGALAEGAIHRCTLATQKVLTSVKKLSFNIADKVEGTGGEMTLKVYITGRLL
jgi:hypothetical protein